MRKCISAFLAILMLASLFVVFPTPTTAAKQTYDQTTKDTVNKIIITEISPNATYHPNGAEESQDKKKFPMNFIELYNNGAGDVQLDSLSLLKGVDFQYAPDFTDPYYEAADGTRLWRLWRENKKFISKMDIKDDAIIDENTAKLVGLQDISSGDLLYYNPVYSMLTNAGQDMTFSANENVILWFIGYDTIDWMIEMEASRFDFNPRAEFIKSFYGANADETDYTILMVWAFSDYTDEYSDHIATDMFTLSAPDTEDRDYIYGVAESTWDLANDKAYDSDDGLNEKLYSIARIGYSIPRYNGFSINDLSVTFALPTTTPYIANAYEALTEINPTTCSNYFEAGLVTSFREVGSICWACAPTPGEMPAWQWAMIAPDKYDAFSTEGQLDPAKIEAAVNAYLNELKLIDYSTAGREEIEKEYNFQVQEDLKDHFVTPSQTHEHFYSNACDATCNDCPNGNRTPTPHVYTGACDDTCDVCGYLKPDADQSLHVFTNACDNTCNICNTLRPTLWHVYTDEADQTCNICEKPRS